MDTEKVSIGSIGEVAWDAINDRWKGVLTTVHKDAREVVDTFTGVIASCHGGSRIAVRIFLARGADIELISRIQLPWQTGILTCEALIPVRHGGSVGALAYFGANTTERKTPIDVTRQEWRLLNHVLEQIQGQRKIDRAFRVKILKRLSVDDRDALRTLYQTSYLKYMTEFNEGTIDSMFENNVIAVARIGGRIVAVCQAEIASVDVEIDQGITGRERWNLVEISETATDLSYRGRGLSQACRALLIRTIDASRTIIYAESRANHAAVLKANINLGMKVAGRLEKHCVMDSLAQEVPQEGPYANLFVCYLP